ncbi:MAG: ABC transporter permease [Eubacteriales bacterium]
MYDIFKITKNILHRIIMKRSNILIHIIVPISVIFGMTLLFSGGGSSKYNASVVDLSQSKSSEYLLNEIEASGKFKISEIEEKDAESYITEGSTSFVLIIPEDFEEKLLAGEMPEVKMMSLKESEGAGWMQVSLNMQIGNMKDAVYGAGYDEQMYYGLLNKIAESTVKLKTEKVNDYSQNMYMTQPIIGMYLMLILMSASTTAFLILDEKRKGTFARIGTAPVSPRSYILANVVSNVIILSIQLSIVLILLSKVAKIEFFTSTFNMFIILFAYVLCCIGFGVLVASATNKIARANAMLYLILTPTCMISGCFWPIEFMPDILQKAALITPQRWALNALDFAQNGESMVMPLLILVAYASLLFIGAAYLMKYKQKQ